MFCSEYWLSPPNNLTRHSSKHLKPYKWMLVVDLGWPRWVFLRNTTKQGRNQLKFSVKQNDCKFLYKVILFENFRGENFPVCPPCLWACNSMPAWSAWYCREKWVVWSHYYQANHKAFLPGQQHSQFWNTTHTGHQYKNSWLPCSQPQDKHWLNYGVHSCAEKRLQLTAVTPFETYWHTSDNLLVAATGSDLDTTRIWWRQGFSHLFEL